MSNVGLNTTTAAHAGGCGGAAPSAAAMPAIPAGFTGGGFAIPTIGYPNAAMAMPAMAMPAMAAMPAPERFASSMAGGVIIGKDGVPAGRIPAGSFVDTKDGTIFGPDGKAIALPEGATADFFDLPDTKELMEMAKAASTQAERMAAFQKAMAEGGGTTTSGPDGKPMDHASMMQSFVDGQWGPGGVTPIKGGGTAAGCDAEHGAPATKAGGATATGATTSGATTSTNSTGTTSAVAGASGGGATTTLESLTAQITSLMDQVKRLTPTPTSGGGGTLVAASGAATLGSTDALRLSVNDLVSVIAQLNVALDRVGIRGGGPGQGPLQFPVPPAKPATPPPSVEPPKTEAPKTEAPKTDAPKTETPKTEPPKTEVPSTSSGSGDTTTAPPASGSSSN